MILFDSRVRGVSLNARNRVTSIAEVPKQNKNLNNEPRKKACREGSARHVQPYIATQLFLFHDPIIFERATRGTNESFVRLQNAPCSQLVVGLE